MATFSPWRKALLRPSLMLKRFPTAKYHEGWRCLLRQITPYKSVSIVSPERSPPITNSFLLQCANWRLFLRSRGFLCFERKKWRFFFVMRNWYLLACGIFKIFVVHSVPLSGEDGLKLLVQNFWIFVQAKLMEKFLQI